VSALLEIRTISKRYGRTRALSAVSLLVASGEFAVLLGPAGSGKTTLLSILGGLVEPDGGQVFLGGKDITALAPLRRPVATVFQGYALFPHMSVARNVAFGLVMRKVPRAARDERVAAVLELMGLTDVGARCVHELTGAQRLRVALARALALEPQVLLLDEPLGALEWPLRQPLQDELRQLQRRTRTTFILATHDPDEALHLADTLVVMQGGRIADKGPPRRVYLRPANVFTAKSLGPSNLLPGRVVAAVADTVQIETACGLLALAAPLAVGTPVMLALRPEQVRIGDATDTDGIALALGRATLTELVFAGSYLRCRAQAKGFQWQLHVPPHSRLAIGAALELYAQRDDLVLLK
jgi:spermidine/putrescine transport system ATP-binding protein